MQDIDGKDVSLSKFKGKALLIVNVASKWYSRLTDDFAALNTCVSAKVYPLFYFVYYLKSQSICHIHFNLWYNWIFFFFFNHSGLTPSNYSELSHIYEKYKTQGMLQKMEDSAVIFSFKIFWKLTLTPNWTAINMLGCLSFTFQKFVHTSSYCFGVISRSKSWMHHCSFFEFVNKFSLLFPYFVIQITENVLEYGTKDSLKWQSFFFFLRIHGNEMEKKEVLMF